MLATGAIPYDPGAMSGSLTVPRIRYIIRLTHWYQIMTKSALDTILDRLNELQQELELEIDRLLEEKRQLFHYTIEQGKVKFEAGIKALQAREKISSWNYLRNARAGHLLTAPIIYGVFLPFVLLDIAVTCYQQICFRVYGIPRVRRSDYFILDRQKLAYLNTIEKFNCTYCSYANGLAEYVREITARSEQYWCPIKHTQRSPDPHRFTEGFVDYGDAERYRQQIEVLRREITELRG